MKKFEKWQGIDNDLEESLFEYHVILRKAINPEEDEYEYQSVCKYSDNAYIITGIDARYIEEKIKDIEDWSSRESFLSFFSMSNMNEFRTCDLLLQVSNLLQYFGYEEIMGGGGNFGHDIKTMDEVMKWLEENGDEDDEEVVPGWAQVLLVSSGNGVYIYRAFWENWKSNLTPESLKKLEKIELSELDPEYEFCHEVWQKIEGDAILEIKGRKYYIRQIEDLWAIHEDYMFGDDDVLRKNPATDREFDEDQCPGCQLGQYP